MNTNKIKTLLGSSALILLVAGCATSKDALTSLETSSMEANKNATSAQQTATDAKQAAQSAQSAANGAQNTADTALSKANEALEKARMALEKSERNEAAINDLNEKIDRMFKKTMHK